MGDKTFAVIFTGQLVEGNSHEQVMANFAQLFRVEMAKVAPMFTGSAVTIKKGLDEATARKYQQALHQAGAVCRLIDLAAQSVAEPAATSAPPTAEAPATRSGSGPAVPVLNATLAEAGVLIVEPEQVETPQIDTSQLSMGAVGETLAEPDEVPPLQVDISALTMAEAGVRLVPPSSVETPAIDFGRLSLAEPGATLHEHEEIKPADIDTSDISLA